MRKSVFHKILPQANGVVYASRRLLSRRRRRLFNDVEHLCVDLVFHLTRVCTHVRWPRTRHHRQSAMTGL